MAGGLITGVMGQIKWAYYVAAEVHGYTITRTPENQWAVVGFVGVSDAFKLAQRPLTFIAPHAKGEWRWPILSLTVDPNQHLSAQLGVPEE